MEQYEFDERDFPLCQEIWDQYVVPLLREKFPKQPEKALWVTLNFAPDTSVDDVLRLASKVASKKWVKNYRYTIEQRKPYPDPFSGFHVHMLLDTDKYASQAQNEIYVTLKKRVGNKRHIYIVQIKDKKIYADKIDYLKGKKWDPEKDLKIRNDIEFRKRYNLKNVYTSFREEEKDEQRPLPRPEGEGEDA